MEEPRYLKASEIKIGMEVGLWNGVVISPAEVIEDLGNSGYRGRRMYRLLVESSAYRGQGGLEFAAALDDLVEVPPPEKPTRRSRARKRPTLQAT
jgi:hypothetical protein